MQWLCEQCVYVRCRTTAVRVWQVLLELGVLLSGKKTKPPHMHAQTQTVPMLLTFTVTFSNNLHIFKKKINQLPIEQTEIKSFI